MRFLILAAILACAGAYNNDVKSVKGGHSYRPGGDMYRANNTFYGGYNNNTYGGGGRPTQPPINFEVGVCYIEVPTASLVRDKHQIPAGNGSRSDLSRIRTCCQGYTRNVYNFKICDPVCSKGCENALCTAPETCTCFPDHVRNHVGSCVATCPIGCHNGQCYGGECMCKEGYSLDVGGKFCVPICRHNCGGQGNCTAPNTCKCNPGYKTTLDGACQVDCGKCTNGDCVSPTECRCRPGFEKDSSGQCVAHCSQNCGPNGKCIAPNVCSDGSALGQGPTNHNNLPQHPNSQNPGQNNTYYYNPNTGSNYPLRPYNQNGPQQPNQGQQPNPAYPNQGSGYPHPNPNQPQQGSNYPSSNPNQPQYGSNYPLTNPDKTQHGSNYPPSNPNQPQHGSNYPPTNPDQSQHGSNYPPMNPGQSQHGSNYPSSNPDQNQYGSNYPSSNPDQNQHGSNYPSSNPNQPQHGSIYPSLNPNQPQQGQNYPQNPGSYNPQYPYGQNPNQPNPNPLYINVTYNPHQLSPDSQVKPNGTDSSNPGQHYPGNQMPNPYPYYPSNQGPGYAPVDPYYQQPAYGQQLDNQCPVPCVNGQCIGPNRCRCHPGYVTDEMDPYGVRCRPHCPGGCMNGYCAAPHSCACDEGYYRDTSVKGRAVCVKRIRRSLPQLVFNIPDYAE